MYTHTVIALMFSQTGTDVLPHGGWRLEIKPHRIMVPTRTRTQAAWLNVRCCNYYTTAALFGSHASISEVMERDLHWYFSCKLCFNIRVTLYHCQVIATGGGFGRISDIRPSDESLFEVQKYVQQRLEFKWLPLFLSSEEFLKRQHPSGTLGDVAEDAMAQHKRKTQAVARVYTAFVQVESLV